MTQYGCCAPPLHVIVISLQKPVNRGLHGRVLISGDPGAHNHRQCDCNPFSWRDVQLCSSITLALRFLPYQHRRYTALHDAVTAPNCLVSQILWRYTSEITMAGALFILGKPAIKSSVFQQIKEVTCDLLAVMPQSYRPKKIFVQ